MSLHLLILFTNGKSLPVLKRKANNAILTNFVGKFVCHETVIVLHFTIKSRFIYWGLPCKAFLICGISTPADEKKFKVCTAPGTFFTLRMNQTDAIIISWPYNQKILFLLKLIFDFIKKNSSDSFFIYLKYCSNFWHFSTFKHFAICQSEVDKVLASNCVTIYQFYNHFFRIKQFMNKNIN